MNDWDVPTPLQGRKTARRFPLRCVLSRYLARQFLGFFLGAMVVFVSLYLLVDFLERLDILLRHQAAAGAAARYFLFKIPLMMTQVCPPAVMSGLLLSLGFLARGHEMVAIRAGGVSLSQMVRPVILTAGGISVGVLLWNESIVPYCTRRVEYVNNVEIRKRQMRGILSDREVWYRGSLGFYNIEHVDKKQGVVYGLTVFRFSPQLELQSVLEIPRAEWTGEGWRAAGAVRRSFANGEPRVEDVAPGPLPIEETLQDFLEVRRKPEELSFLALRRWLQRLSARGIDVTEYWVELHLKLAVPFANTVLALIAVPIAGSLRRRPSVAAIVAVGSAAGFLYWVVLALGRSLGHTGALPAAVAAWSANVLFATAAVALLARSE